MGVIHMKKAKYLIIAIILLFLLSCSSIISYNNINNSASNSINQEINSPKLSNPGKSLLHSYDFEDDIISQDPTGITLSVKDPIASGTLNIANLGDVQQNHVALYKSGGSQLIQLSDNVSFYGQDFEEGEIHFKFYNDGTLYGIHMRDAIGLLFAIDLWSGNVGRYSGIIYTTYTLNQWTNFTMFYKISLGWMFEINGVKFGDGYSYPFEGGGPSGLTEIRWRSAFSGGGIGYLRLDDIAFYYETENPIIRNSPEIPSYNPLLLSLIIVVGIMGISLKIKRKSK